MTAYAILFSNANYYCMQKLILTVTGNVTKPKPKLDFLQLSGTVAVLNLFGVVMLISERHPFHIWILLSRLLMTHYWSWSGNYRSSETRIKRSSRSRYRLAPITVMMDASQGHVTGGTPRSTRRHTGDIIGRLCVQIPGSRWHRVARLSDDIGRTRQRTSSRGGNIDNNPTAHNSMSMTLAVPTYWWSRDMSAVTRWSAVNLHNIRNERS